MVGFLHTPGAAPRQLTAQELASLNPDYGHHWLRHCLSLPIAAAPALQQVLGSALPVEVIDCSRLHLLIGLENAADYDLAPTPSIIAPLNKWAGGGWTEDEPLVGPLLLITA